ncbi:MAG: hypothetical protein ACI9VR_004629 [Cognaticolwellia sp.]|jgi:hypothetical protein
MAGRLRRLASRMKNRVLGPEPAPKVPLVAVKVSVLGREDRVLSGVSGVPLISLLRELPYARPCLDHSCGLCAIEVIVPTGIDGLEGGDRDLACTLRIQESGGELRVLWPYSMEAVYGAE